MARRASRATQGRALGAALLLVVAACGDGGGAQPGGVVTVSVAWPGASPLEAEQALLEPVEHALAGVKGVHGLRGRAFEGRASVEVTFQRGVSADEAKQAVRAALEAVRAQLPEDAELPMTGERPAAWVIARATDQPRAFDQVRAEVERLPIVRLERCGVREARLALELVPAKLLAAGVTSTDVSAALGTQALTLPAGRVDASRPDQLRVVAEGAPWDEVANIIVGDNGVRVRDVAVMSQRSEAACLVEDPAGQARALVRVGVRHPRDAAAVVKGLAAAQLTPVRQAITVARAGRPVTVELVPAPVGPVVEAIVVGDDAAALAAQGRDAMTSLRTQVDVAAAWCQACETDVTFEARIDRARAAELLVGVTVIAAAVRAATIGEHVATYRDGDLELGVVLGVEEGETRWSELPIRAGDGRMLRLADVATLEAKPGPRDLLHVDGRRAVALRLRGGPKTSVAALRKLATSVLPAAKVRTLDPVSVDADPW